MGLYAAKCALTLIIIAGAWLMQPKPVRLTNGLPNVFILTFSGLNSEDSISDPNRQYIPYLANYMFDKGTLYTNLINKNIAFHITSVEAINSGRSYRSVDLTFSGNKTNNQLFSPSLFQYFLKQYGYQRTKAWTFGHWENLNNSVFYTKKYPEYTYPCFFSVRGYASPELYDILSPQERDSINRFQELNESKVRKITFWFNWESISEATFELFTKVVHYYHPKLVHYVLNGVESAHYSPYSSYIYNLKRSDEKIYELFKIITQDPFYKDNTYLFIVVDHGRDKNFQEHRTFQSEGDNPVWLYIYGPGVRKGGLIGRKVYHSDVFSTIAALLRLRTYKHEGAVLIDAFEKNAAIGN